ncbi:MAG: cysteine peptidase family C39 domain-containing protein, partial [Candidatus Omnitrophota bacterium]
LLTEEEIISYLYSIIKPGGLATLNQLENDYNISVAEKEAAWQDFSGSKASLDDYYSKLDYLDASLQSVYLQISSVKQKLEQIDLEKQDTLQAIGSLEAKKTDKNAAIQAKLQQVSAQEAQCDDLKNTLALLQTDKATLKSALKAAEAVLVEKTAQKETRETELNTLSGNLAAKQTEVQDANNTAGIAQAEFDSAIELVHQLLGPAFDIHTSSYDKIYDGNGDLIGVNIPGHSPDEEKENALLDALYKEKALQEAQALLTQKEAELSELQAQYDAALDSYNSAVSEYNSAYASYQAALSAFNSKSSEVDTAQDNLTQAETDLLSGYEGVKLLECDVNAIDAEISTKTAHREYLGNMAADLQSSLDEMNTRRIELEDLYSGTLSEIEMELEDSGAKDKMYAYKEAVENERRARSLYQEALEARDRLINSLKNENKELQSDLLTIILGYDPEETAGPEDQAQVQAAGQVQPMTEEEINNLILGIDESMVLANGRTYDAAQTKIENTKRALREAYKSVFGKEPSIEMLNAFVDITTRAKMPALRLFEVITRIEDKKLKANDDEKLDVEDNLRDLAESELQQKASILQNIITRLESNDPSGQLLRGAISYLTSLPGNLVTCGAIALGGLFDLMGRPVSESKITEEAVLSDIFSGAISENTEGGLRLSLYALKEAAEANGEKLYGKKLTTEDLANMTSPFIAHVNGNHYVLVKKIENGMITYHDPAPGMDLKTSVRDFGCSFTGFALTLSEAGAGTLLQDDEMRSISGAGLFSRFRSAVKRAVSKMTRSVSRTVKKVSSSVKKAVSKVSKSVSRAVKKVSSSAKKTVSKVSKSVSSAAKKVSSSAKKTVSKAAKVVSSAVKNVAKSVKKTVSNAAEAVVSAARSAAQTVKNAATDAYNAVKETVTSAYNTAKDAVVGAYNTAKEAVIGAYNTAKDTAAGTYNTAKETITGIYNDAKSYFSAKYDETQSFFRDTYNKTQTYLENPHNETGSYPLFGLGLIVAPKNTDELIKKFGIIVENIPAKSTGKVRSIWLAGKKVVIEFATNEPPHPGLVHMHIPKLGKWKLGFKSIAEFAEKLKQNGLGSLLKNDEVVEKAVSVLKKAEQLELDKAASKAGKAAKLGKGLKLIVPIIGFIIGMAFDVHALSEAVETDSSQGGGCEVETTSGRIIGETGAVLAVGLALSGSGIGTIPGLIITGIALIAGGLIGEHVGTKVCEVAGTGISEETGTPPALQNATLTQEDIDALSASRTPIHETISSTPDNMLHIDIPVELTPEDQASLAAGRTPIRETISTDHP